MNINSEAILIFNWEEKPIPARKEQGRDALCTTRWKAFVSAVETNGGVLCPLPSSPVGWERLLQGLRCWPPHG